MTWLVSEWYVPLGLEDFGPYRWICTDWYASAALRQDKVMALSVSLFKWGHHGCHAL